MKYRVILCGGLLATAVLLSAPNSSSALPGGAIRAAAGSA